MEERRFSGYIATRTGGDSHISQWNVAASPAVEQPDLPGLQGAIKERIPPGLLHLVGDISVTQNSVRVANVHPVADTLRDLGVTGPELTRMPRAVSPVDGGYPL
jgi:hypothetical protein